MFLVGLALTNFPFQAAAQEKPSLGGFEELELQGRLEGSTLLSKYNLKDPRAGGQDTIDIVFEAPASGWVGFAVNDNGGFMVRSEAVIGLPETGEVLKYFLGGYSVAGVQPMPEANQTLIDASISQDSGTTVLRFTKILVEPGEIPINIEVDNTFLGAWGFSNSLRTHSRRGTFTLSGQLIVSPREQGLWKAHGWFAALAWSLLCPLAIASSVLRSFFPGESLWFKLHRALNILVVTFTIAAFAIAVAAINSETPSGASSSHFDKQFSNGHRTIGLAIFILAFIQALGGFFRPHLPQNPSAKDEEDGQPEAPPSKSTLRVLWEGCHKVLGGGLLGICWYQVQLGIKSYHDIFGLDETAALATFWALAGTLGSIILFGYFLKYQALNKDP